MGAGKGRNRRALTSQSGSRITSGAKKLGAPPSLGKVVGANISGAELLDGNLSGAELLNAQERHAPVTDSKRRFIISTMYHVFTVWDTKEGKPSAGFGAKSYGGDRGARAEARKHCDKLNLAEEERLEDERLRAERAAELLGSLREIEKVSF